MKTQNVLNYFLLAILSVACATLENFREEMVLQSLNVELLQDREFYIQALKRWPDLSDASQIQRRALILSAHPSKHDLQKLDDSRDENTEFQILKKLDLRRLVSTNQG